jgi:Zn-dependent peptidase ImmA (M78 family)/DNA-binding XRE family transcriptional regulator
VPPVNVDRGVTHEDMTSGKALIGKRLKRTREGMGLSLRDLESAISREVSAQAIGKYERDEMMPSAPVLRTLARALKVTPEYLLNRREARLSGLSFRRPPFPGSRDLRALEAALLERVERLCEIEELVPGAEEPWKGPAGGVWTIASAEEAENAAEALRKHWSLGSAPIDRMAILLEDRRIRVLAVDLPESFDGSAATVSRVDGTTIPTLVVNSRLSGDRQRLALARELAHLVLRIDVDNETESERLAERFGSALLMNRQAVLRALGPHRKSIPLGELAHWKQIFGVSICALAERCAQLEILPKAATQRLLGEIRRLGWNRIEAQEPFAVPPEAPARMVSLCLRALGEQALTPDAAAELLSVSPQEVHRLLAAQPA